MGATILHRTFFFKMNKKNPNLPLTYFAGTHTGKDIFIGHCRCWMAQTSSFEQDLLAS